MSHASARFRKVGPMLVSGLQHLRRNLIAYLALLLALSGTSYAAIKLPSNSVGSPQVIDRSLQKADLSRKAVAALRGARGVRGPQGIPGVDGEQGPQGPPGIFTVGRVELTYAEVDPAARTEVGAFIPTNSSSGKCLVTLNESNAATHGTTVYCGTRHFNGVDGVYVHVLLPDVAPAGLLIDISVYQESAQQYGMPVLYPRT
jgi:hypothetical protein